MEVPDDTLFYQVFSDSALASDAVPLLHDLRIAALDVLEPLTRPYIWQHDPFNLRVASEIPPLLRQALDTEEQIVGRSLGIASFPSFSSDHAIPHLFGKVKYGDNVEDEWFVVYLLYQLSRHFPDVSIRVWDTDGEFLLIEAAYAIPSWLKPENSRNRVFIRSGNLHILPMPSSPADLYTLPVMPSLRTSLDVLKSGVKETNASAKVQAAIANRLLGYPEKAQKNIHRVRCTVPLGVGQILRMEPQLISLAVEAFYNRDLDSMKAVSRMEKFLPKSSEGQVEMVNTVVSMSRAMYAQLVQQVFQAPRCYPMPPPSPRYKEAEIGMKLACGFEMIYRGRQNSKRSEQNSEDAVKGNGGHVVDFTLPLGDSKGQSIQGIVESTGCTDFFPQSDVGWQAFRKSLESRGYFRGLLEGSKEHRSLMQAAIARYKQTSLFSRVSAAMQAPVSRINEILSLPHSTLDFSDVDLQESDEDSWLYTGEQDLQNALHERQKEIDAYEAERVKCRKSRKKASKDGAFNVKARDNDEEEYNPQELARSMKAFVKTVASFEGAEIPGVDTEDMYDEDVSPKKLLDQLEAAFDFRHNDIDVEEDNSLYSSMESDCSESEESDVEVQALDQCNAQECTKRIDTARPTIHSDDDLETYTRGRGDTFMEEYSEILQEELKTTSIAKTFSRVEDMPETSGEFKDIGGAGGNTDDLRPVDVNYNLVKNLLKSYASQHGMPGPASNLLGAMGLQLPDDLTEEDKKGSGR